MPFVVSWKDKLPAGKVYEQPVIQLDFLPTVLAAAGVEIKTDWKLDGVNLLPYLKGEATAAPHKSLYWRLGQQMAIRSGDWKLVKYSHEFAGEKSSETLSPLRLYDLSRDIGETNDLASAEPQKLKESQASLGTMEPNIGRASMATSVQRARPQFQIVTNAEVYRRPRSDQRSRKVIISDTVPFKARFAALLRKCRERISLTKALQCNGLTESGHSCWLSQFLPRGIGISDAAEPVANAALQYWMAFAAQAKPIFRRFYKILVTPPRTTPASDFPETSGRTLSVFFMVPARKLSRGCIWPASSRMMGIRSSKRRANACAIRGAGA